MELNEVDNPKFHSGRFIASDRNGRAKHRPFGIGCVSFSMKERINRLALSEFEN